MKVFPLLSFALAAAANPLLSTRAAHPKPPTVSLLFSANITIDDPIIIGQTPFGFEVIVQVTGGAFKGPRLAGAHLLPSKLPLFNAAISCGNTLNENVTGNPPTNRATATYVLTTNDGTNIVVSEQAAIPYVEVLFEAGNGKYGYLNNVTAWATGSEENNVISLNFWQLSAPAA
ncbi:hypothetical protein G7Y79_00078g100120 [Physcia stellaris]|nr:hypothetical protein G7Y79_00078g100120 [Physcia stellaris]